MMKPITVKAIYTGGSIWLFFGKIDDGNYFLTDDMGATLLLRENPGEDLESACHEDWQQENLIREISGAERRQFCLDMLQMLRSYPYGSEENGGITEGEISRYMKTMRGDI